MNLQGKLRCKIFSGDHYLQLQDKVNNWLRITPVDIVRILCSHSLKSCCIYVFYYEDDRYGTK